jgi:hypothetical protein
MSRVAIILSIIAMILASAARAELRTLPGSTTEVAVKRIGCTVVVDGHELMNGTCHYRLTDSADVFMTLPEAVTQIAVNVSRRGEPWERRFVRLWMRAQDGKRHRVDLGSLGGEDCQRPNENIITCACWANQRVRICSWPLQANRPPGAPSELPSPSPGEAYFPPPQPARPLSPSEQQRNEQMNELTKRIDKIQEKITKQPPVR